MDSLTYLKITFQPDSFPAYHFYYILYKDQLIKYDIILNGSFSIDFGFYDSESIDETMIEYSIITESEEINAINIFLQYFHNSFDILEYIYKKINNNDKEALKLLGNYESCCKLDDNTDDNSDDNLEYTEAKNNFDDIMTETENITDIINIALRDAIMEKDIDIIRQTIESDKSLIIKDDDVSYAVLNMLIVHDHIYCRYLLSNIEEVYGNDMMVKIINNDYTEESNNDIPLLYKLIKYMFKNKSNVDIEFMIYLHGYTNMDKIDQNNGMSLKDFILDIQDQYSNKDYDHDIDKIISFIKMIE
jgi:hypothetical protein